MERFDEYTMRWIRDFILDRCFDLVMHLSDIKDKRFRHKILVAIELARREVNYEIAVFQPKYLTAELNQSEVNCTHVN